MHSAQAYAALVERLAALAQRHPLRYKLQLALLAWLGFAVLGGAVLLALAIGVGTIALLIRSRAWALIKFAWIPIAFAWLVLRSMWVRFEEPSGVRLQRDSAPQLFAEVERIRRAARAPRLSGGILVNDELNAAAASVPRAMGLLGTRHFLVLGLPLMQCLDREQLAAVLAHEFGHFGGGHTHFAGWIYRVRAAWYNVLERLDEEAGWASGPLVAFFRWYAPYFNAYSFVLARSNEYDADAMAARIAGAPAAAQALVAVSLASKRLDRDFWPEVTRRAQRDAEPPVALYRWMGDELASPSVAASARLDESLREESGLDDTHPVLAKRLAALGQPPALPPSPAAHDRADGLLGEAARHRLVDHFSSQWRRWVERDWKQRHSAASEGRQRLASLDAEPLLSPEELAEQACLRMRLEPGEAAVAALRAASLACPPHAETRYRLGVELMERDDADAVSELEAAIAADASFEEAALHRLYEWHMGHGGSVAAQPARARLEDFYRRAHEAQRERGTIDDADQYEPHRLGVEAHAAVQEAARRGQVVGTVWVARKRVKHRPDAPHYVLLVKWRNPIGNEGRLEMMVEFLPATASWMAADEAAFGASKSRLLEAAGDPVFVN
jgi:Zn-dependent protease with chaperone function